jgi:hypothetical protein
VKSVAASTDSNAILCVIPTASDPPYATTMAEIHKAAALQPNQVLENLREDHTYRSWLGFYCTTTLTISGDVIELVPTKATADATEEPTPCAAAYEQLGLLPGAIRRVYPKASAAIPSAPRPAFMKLCLAQTEPVQACIQARYLQEHVDECAAVLRAMPARDRWELLTPLVTGYDP